MDSCALSLSSKASVWRVSGGWRGGDWLTSLLCMEEACVCSTCGETVKGCQTKESAGSSYKRVQMILRSCHIFTTWKVFGLMTHSRQEGYERCALFVAQPLKRYYVSLKGFLVGWKIPLCEGVT